MGLGHHRKGLEGSAFARWRCPSEWGGHGADFVSQALVMAELARGDSAMSKAFSQNWKWSHLISMACNEDQKKRFLKPFLADHRYVMGKGITEPNAGSDNRMPPDDDPKAGYRLRAERKGDEWMLNGEKCFIANGSVGSLFFVDARSNPDVNIKQGGTLFMVPKGTPGFRIGKVFNKTRLAFLPERRTDIRKRARAARQRAWARSNGGVKAGTGDTTGGDLFGDLELAAQRARRVRRGVRNGDGIRAHAQARRQVADRAATGATAACTEMHMLTEALRSYVMRTAWEHEAKVRIRRTPGW